MTVDQALNRGYNLMLTAFVLLTGLAFASGGLRENDVTDKLDDLGLLALGIILLVWYLMRENRLQRSLVPVVVVVLALFVQIFGLLNEFNDKEAVGNDFGGMFIYVPLVLFTFYQYLRRPRVEATRPPA
jgi:drug/metabolite transporter superfamily protein YnfA